MTNAARLLLYYWLPVIVYCTLIFLQSAGPVTAELPAIPGMDKVLHFSGYALLGFLFSRAFRAQMPDASGRLVMALSVIAVTLYGASDEYHQSFVPARMADSMDLVADAAGGFAGVLAHRFLIRLRLIS